MIWHSSLYCIEQSEEMTAPDRSLYICGYNLAAFDTKRLFPSLPPSLPLCTHSAPHAGVLGDPVAGACLSLTVLGTRTAQKCASNYQSAIRSSCYQFSRMWNAVCSIPSPPSWFHTAETWDYVTPNINRLIFSEGFSGFLQSYPCTLGWLETLIGLLQMHLLGSTWPILGHALLWQV